MKDFSSRRWIAPVCLVLAVCAFFHRTFLGERFYAVDFSQTFVPLRAILADAWAHGLPSWSARLGNGGPVLANPAYGAFYLPNLLWRGLDPARSMTLLTVAHFALGSLGAWVLARRWGMSRAGAWTTGVVFALGGPAVASIPYPNLSWPLGLLPWALVAFDEVVNGRRALGCAALALVWASMLSMGDPIVMIASFMGVGMLAVTEPRKAVVRKLVPIGIGLLGAALLVSPLVVAVLRYLPTSVRGAGFKAEGIVQFSLHPLLLTGAAIPNPFGDPEATGAAGFWASALASDRGQPLLAGFYVGMLALALALLGALRSSRHRTVLLVWLGFLLLLALGKYGPIYPLAGAAPGFDALRYPMKWIVPATLPLALLAGFGVDRISEAAADSARLKRYGLVLLAGLGVLALISLCVMSGLNETLARLARTPDLTIGGEPLAAHIRHAWVASATRSAGPVALALLALIAVVRGRPRVSLAPALAAFVTLDLMLANGSLAPTVSKEFYAMPRAARAILDDPAGHARVYVDDGSAEVLRYASDDPSGSDAAGFHRERLMAYVGAESGLDLAFNVDTEAYSQMTYARAGVLVRGAPLREKLMLLGSAGVGHIVTFEGPQGVLQSPIASLSIGFDHPLFVYRNPLALPRVRVVPRLTPYDADAGFIRAVQTAPDDFFRHTALVDVRDLDAVGVSADGATAEGGTARVTEDAGHRLSIRTEGPGGFLIVSDTLAPGWEARIDGQPAPIVRVDLAFRGIPISAGGHDVVMAYQPW